LDIGVLGYIGIVQHKEHSPEVFHIPPGTPCILIGKVCLRHHDLLNYGTDIFKIDIFRKRMVRH